MIDSNDARILALRAAHPSRSIPMGSIDSNYAFGSPGHLTRISIRSLQLVQAFALLTPLS